MSEPRWWHPKDHPVWNLVHMTAAFVCALVLGWVNASHFDAGEIFTALGSVGVARAIFGGRSS